MSRVGFYKLVIFISNASLYMGALFLPTWVQTGPDSQHHLKQG